MLLHVATHIVDQVLGLSDDHANPLFAGLWVDNRELAAPYAASPIAQTRCRGAPPIPLAMAPAAYEAIRDCPFVSFYATAAAPEDLAELFDWQHLVTEMIPSAPIPNVLIGRPFTANWLMPSRWAWASKADRLLINSTGATIGKTSKGRTVLPELNRLCGRQYLP